MSYWVFARQGCTVSTESSEEKDPEIWGILLSAHSLSSDVNTLPGPGQGAGGIVVSEAAMVPILMEHKPASCTEQRTGMVRNQDSPGEEYRETGKWNP